jgi:CRISPR system Cascade subunit CasB
MSEPPTGTDEGAEAHPPEVEAEATVAEPSSRGAGTFAWRKTQAVVNAIAHELGGGFSRKLEGKLSPGDVAALRRLGPADPASPAFWRVVALHLEPAGLLPQGSGPLRDETERRWALLLSGMARCAGLHRPGEKLGRGLVRAKYAEVRFSRLLRASGEALGDALRALTHQLASSATHVDWAELAELILSDGKPWAEGVRRRIARDYYGELYRAERPENGGETT